MVSSVAKVTERATAISPPREVVVVPTTESVERRDAAFVDHLPPLSEADAVERTPRLRRRPSKPSGARVAAQPLEALSPFVAWSAEVEVPLDVGLARRSPSVLIEIVTAPEAFAARILDGAALQSAVVGALVAAVLGFGAFAGLVRLDEGLLVAALSGGRLALSVLLAVAAAIGPIHATGVLVAARVPLARLVAVMLSATAAGALVLAPLGPIVRLLHHHDAMWFGPLALMAAVFVAAAFAGVTLRRVLLALARVMARSRDRTLSDNELFRVGIVSRMALVFLGFTSMLALWGLGAFA